jgi:TnpA family transposase
MRARELLTPEDRLQYTELPDDIDERILAIHFMLTSYDIEIIKRHRKPHNLLGFAIQLCILRYLGCTLMDVRIIPDIILNYISKQLSINNEGLELYATATKYDHLEEIKKIYGFKNFTIKEYRIFLKLLYQTALSNDVPAYLIETALKALRKDKIIFPAITTIERAAWKARKMAESKIFKLLCLSLTPADKEKLNNLTLPMQNSDKTYLGWLKETTGHSSPYTFLKVIEKLEYIRKIELKVNTEAIHPNRLRQLSKICERYKPYVLRRFPENKRYAILVAYLISLSQDLTDQAFEIHHRQILTLQNKGRKAQDELQRKNGKSINEKVVHFANLGSALIKAKEDNIDPFVAIESIMPWDKVVESVKEANDLLRPIDYDYLDLLDKKFNHLRKYTPTLIQSLKFKSVKSSEPLIKALDTIHEMNKAGKRKLPDNPPLDFISKRWKKYVYEKDGSINRHYYEMAVLTELCNNVKSGNVWIEGSKQHKDFNEYIISLEKWKKVSDKGLAVDSSSSNNYIEEQKATLQSRLTFLSENIDHIDDIELNKDGFSLQRLEKDTPDEAKELSQSLYNLLPRIKLTDLLTEVAHWTGFDKKFIHASTGKEPNENEKIIVLATLMALGTNIGLSKMAEATADISYNQMRNTSQWRFYDEVITKAQAILVNFHHKLELSSLWGKGNTSSSDGMRVQVGVSSLHADINPHYGFKKGVTIYRFTSDQFSSFYTKVINTNARDAIHVIDGLLHHETDLNIEEHYTDTAGYTDQVFGLAHLLGFRFAPRLRDLSDSKLYLIDKANSFENIDSLFNGKINLNLIKENYDDVLRLAYSIKEGIVSGSLIMSKLGSYSRQNKIATALREMGRIEKTIFILNYISDKTFRKRIQKGLNKGEAMNALARAIYFGKHGEFREKSLQEQLQVASALSILINAVTIWNTVYLTQAIKYLKSKQPINEELLCHVSPLAWEHINFLGDYSFDLKEITTLDSLKPLNIKQITDYISE